MTTENPKSKAWDLIGASYWNAGYDGGPSSEQIEAYLQGIGHTAAVAVIGASTRELIRACVPRCAELTVLDFSPEMLAALRADLGEGGPRLVRQDITAALEPSLAERFDYVLADRLVNRFVEDEIRAALGQMLRLLRPGGELRTSIRLGLYERDLPLIEAAERRGTAGFFDPQSWVIDYSKAGDLLGPHIAPHGRIPHDVLLQFYRDRGPEKRLRADDVARYVAATRAERRALRVVSAELLPHSDTDTLYRIAAVPADG